MKSSHRALMKLEASAVLKKFILVLMGMAAVEGVLYGALGSKRDYLEAVYQWSGIVDVYWISLFVLIYFLGTCFGDKNNAGYTIKRLPVTEQEVFHMTWAFNFCALAVLTAFQAIIICVISFMEAETVSEICSAIYGSRFINTIVPLLAVDRIVLLAVFLTGYSLFASMLMYNALNARKISDMGTAYGALLAPPFGAPFEDPGIVFTAAAFGAFFIIVTYARLSKAYKKMEVRGDEVYE